MSIYRKEILSVACALAVLLIAGESSNAQKTDIHISATAMGTSTQLGRVINVDIHVNGYSTPEDQKILLAAFKDNGSRGLTDAVEKMKGKGRISITGTVGYQLNYIREFKQADGSRLIRFVTDRPITFRELYQGTRSEDYTLTMGEVILRTEKSKSTGTLMPAAMLKLDKENELSLEAYQNPWQLTNIRLYD